MDSVQAMLENKLQPGDLLLLGVDLNHSSSLPSFELESLMGKLRCSVWEMGQKAGCAKAFPKMRDEQTPFEFLWVEYFPLLEKDKNGTTKAAHHPFTSPMGIVDVDDLKKVDPLTLLSNSCDLVLNGNEVGGG